MESRIPLTAEDTKKMMVELKGKLNKRDLALSKEAFQKSEKFITTASKCGGADAPASKIFIVKEIKHERVDIEIISGEAFLEEICLMIILMMRRCIWR